MATNKNANKTPTNKTAAPAKVEKRTRYALIDITARDMAITDTFTRRRMMRTIERLNVDGRELTIAVVVEG